MLSNVPSARLSIPQAFQLALEHHRAWRLREAAELYQRIIAAEPGHSEAHHQLGVIAHQTGNHQIAIDHIRQAIALNPGDPAAHSNLGEAYRAAGQVDEAIACFRQALTLAPGLAEARNNLGNALEQKGLLVEAAAAYGQALESLPQSAEVHNNLGKVLTDLGELADAKAALQRSLEIRPDFGLAHYNLGIALARERNFDEAIASYRRALALQPENPAVWCNLGAAFAGKQQLDAAEGALRRALEYQADHADSRCNLGAVLAEQGRSKEAVAEFRKALEFAPQAAGAKFNLALQLLLAGDFAAGWPLFEARWKALGYPRRDFAEPRWDGEPVHGRRILLHAEQGAGDTLQFIRYAALVADRGGVVLVECPESLATLLQRVKGVREVISAGQPLPPFEVHAPLLSLPLIFQTTPETVPREVPYVFAAPQSCTDWQERVNRNGPGMKVGIAWAGDPRQSRDHLRSLPFPALLPLLDVAGIEFFSLQKRVGTGGSHDYEVSPPLSDLTQEIHDFADTAAHIVALDLVISVDTAVAHLAGALGRPVWTLLSFVADWRWGLDEGQSAWYPTMRLFRQPNAGDWESVIERVTAELRQVAGR